MNLRNIGLICLTLFIAEPALAEVAGFQFKSDQQEQQFKDLSEILRCLVCQNQSLADSSAGLAMDLKTELYTQVVNGSSDSDILGFMTDRYGDFILYKPPFNLQTIALWALPFIFFSFGIFALFKFSIIRDTRLDNLEVENLELSRARNLLEKSLQESHEKFHRSK